MGFKEFLPQITTTGRIKTNGTGGETLSFIVYLGPVHLICIANIPGEGETEAPVYVKFKVDTEKRLNQRNASGPRNRNYEHRNGGGNHHFDHPDDSDPGFGYEDHGR